MKALFLVFVCLIVVLYHAQPASAVAKVCTDAGFGSACVCNANTPDNQCQQVWFACTQSGTANLGGLGIMFGLSNGGTSGQSWLIGSDATNAGLSWTPSASGSDKNVFITGLYVSGNRGTPVSDAYPVGQGMIACTLVGTLQLSSSNLNQGAPGNQGQTALVGSRWTRFANGARVKGSNSWSAQSLGTGEFVQITNIPTPNTPKSIQSNSGNLQASGVNVACIAATYNPCGDCPSGSIKLASGCCPANQVNWAASPINCCQDYLLKWSGGYTCCPDSSYTLTKTGTCCKSTSYTGATQDQCCTGSQIVINQNQASATCCDPSQANDARTACCTGSNGPYHATTDVACCPDDKFIANNKACCDDSGSTVVSNSDQGIICCPAGFQSTIAGKQYCCNPKPTGTGTLFWDTNTRKCCLSSNQNDKGYCCEGQGSSSSGYKYTNVMYAGLNQQCCPSAQVVTAGSNTVCCKASIANPTYTDASQSGGQEMQFCCPATNVLNYNGKKYCCPSQPGSGWTWFNGACCPSGRLSSDGSGTPKQCCSGTNPFYYTSVDACCDSSSRADTVNYDCCPKNQIATISGQQYCCWFTPTSGVTYQWVSNKCCDSKFVSRPQNPPAGGVATCCNNFQFPSGASYFTNVDITGSNWNSQQCCPNNYVNSGAPSGRVRCCETAGRVWTNTQDQRFGSSTSGWNSDCCEPSHVLTVGNTKYCCYDDVSSGSWGWTGTTCCLTSQTTTDGTNRYCCPNVQSPVFTPGGETGNNRCCPTANAAPNGNNRFCCANDYDGAYYGNEPPVIINNKCCPVSAANSDKTACCVSPLSGALPSGNDNWQHVDRTASQYNVLCCPNNYVSTLSTSGQSTRYCCPGFAGTGKAFDVTDDGESRGAAQACCPSTKILVQGGSKYCCSSTWTKGTPPKYPDDLTWIVNPNTGVGACCDSKTVVTALTGGTKYCCPTTSTKSPPFQATVNDPCCEKTAVTTPVPNPNSGPFCCQSDVESGVTYTLVASNTQCCPQGQQNQDSSFCCPVPISSYSGAQFFTKVQNNQYFGTDGKTNANCCPNTWLNLKTTTSAQQACCPGPNYQYVDLRDSALAYSYQFCCPPSQVLTPGNGKSYCCAQSSNGQSWIDNGKGGGSCCTTANIVNNGTTSFCCPAAGLSYASNNPCCDPAKISTYFGKTTPYCCPGTTNTATTNDPCCPSGNSNGAASPYCCPAANMKETTVDNNKCCPAAKVVNTGSGTACCQAFTNPVWVAGACCEAAQANKEKTACCVTARDGAGPWVTATDNKCCQATHILADGTCCPPVQFNPSTGACCPVNTTAVGTGPRLVQPIQCCPNQFLSKQGTCCTPANYQNGFSLDSAGNCCNTTQQTGTPLLCCDVSAQDVLGKCCEPGWPRDKQGVCCPADTINCDGYCIEAQPVPKTNDSLGVCCNTSSVLCGYCCTNASDPLACPYQKDINGACCPVGVIDAHNVCYGPDPNGCSGAISCEECIGQTQGCGWCGTIGPDADSTACYSGDVLDPVLISNKTCSNAQGYKWSYIQHNSEITNQTGYFDKEPNRTTVPYFTQVVLAKEDEITVFFQVKVPAITKMDMFWLQDLSNSYGDDLPVIKGLIPQFVANVSQLLPDTNYAFSSFVDKPTPPFGVSGLDYVYKNWQTLTPGGAALSKLLSQTVTDADVLFGTDVPESALDAMITAALAPGNGWRKSDDDTILHIILLCTDAPSHETCPAGSPYPVNVTMCDNVAVTIAEDTYPNLKVNGSWLPSKADGTIPSWTRDFNGDNYGPQQGLLWDFPSRKQMFDALNAGGLNIVPIMCVADTLQVGGTGLITENGITISNATARDYWNSIQRDLGRGVVVPLSTSSDNLIQAVQDAILQLTKVVQLKLQGGNGTQFIINQEVLPPQYAGVTPGQILDFNITLVWDGDVSLGNGPFPIDLLAINPASNQAITPQLADAHVLIYLGFGQECAKCLDFQWSPATEECDPTSPEWLNNPCCNNQCQIRAEEDCTGDNLCLPAICNATGVCNTEIITCESDNRTCGFNSCQPDTGKCAWSCSTARCCDDNDVCTTDVCDAGVCYYKFVDACACTNHSNACDCLNTNDRYLDQNTTLFVKCAFLKGEGCINETAAPDYGYCGENFTKGSVSSSGKDCEKLTLITNATLCAIGKGSSVSVGLIAGVTVGAAVIAAIALAVAIFLIVTAAGNKGEVGAVAAGGDAAAQLSAGNPLYNPGTSYASPLANL